MDGLFYSGTTAGFALAFALLADARRRSRDLERHRATWREYARSRGFRYVPAHTTQHRVDGRIDDLAVTCATGTGVLYMPMTTISALAPVPVVGRLYVSCEDALSRAADDELARTVSVEDPDFNGALFSVKATAPTLAASVLVGRVRSLLVRMSQAGRASLTFRCDRELVAVEWMGHEPVPELLDLGFDLVVAVCASRTKVGAYR